MNHWKAEKNKVVVVFFIFIYIDCIQIDLEILGSIEFVRYVRQCEMVGPSGKGSATPVQQIPTTIVGLSSENIFVDAINAGCSEFHLKPYDLSRVGGRVMDWLLYHEVIQKLGIGK